MDTLAKMAAIALDNDMKVKAMCSRGHWGRVSGYRRNRKGKIVLYGRSLFNTGQRWQSQSPLELKIVS